MRKTRRHHRGRKTRKGGANGNNLLKQNTSPPTNAEMKELALFKGNKNLSPRQVFILRFRNKERTQQMMDNHNKQQKAIAKQKQTDINSIKAARERQLKSPPRSLWNQTVGINFST